MTVLGLWLRLRLVIEKFTGTRFTLVPSLRRAPTRDSGDVVVVSRVDTCRLCACAGVVFTPDMEFCVTGSGGMGAGAV